MKDQSQEAGDNAQQYQAARDIVIVQGVTEERAREIAEAAAREAVLREGRAVAEAIITERVEEITNLVFDKIRAKDPKLFNRFEDPRFLAPLVLVQRSYAETGDRDLGSVLAGLLAEMAGEPIRSRREIVLREAIECAPRLTDQHFNALIVITLLTRMSYRNAPDVDTLITALDNDFRPYYGSIPNDAYEYNYMSATAAGVFIPTAGSTIYSTLFNQHRNAMYPAFRPDEIPDDWTSPDNQPNEALGRELGAMLWLQKADPIEDSTVKVAPAAADRVLSTDRAVEASLTDMERKLRDFVQGRLISENDFITELRQKKPDLAEFLDTIDRTMALSFRPSPVGMMIARQGVTTRSLQAAQEMDKLFDETT